MSSVRQIPRVILDTSTLVSAALRAGSVPEQALLRALHRCEVCASVETIAELELVLGREKFDRYLDRDSRVAFVAVIRRQVRIFTVTAADLVSVDPPCRDPKDDKFLALAIVSEADVIVSSDEDLLVLHPWRGIDIVSQADFLR